MKVLSAPPGQNRSATTGNIISMSKHQSKLLTKVKKFFNKKLNNNWVFGSKEKYKKLEEKLLNYVTQMILDFWDAYYNTNKNIKSIEEASSYGNFGIKVTYKTAAAYAAAVQSSNNAIKAFRHTIEGSLYNEIHDTIHKKFYGTTELIPDYERDRAFYESLYKVIREAIIDNRNKHKRIKIDDKNYCTIGSKKYFEILIRVLMEQIEILSNASKQLTSSRNNSSSSSSNH